MFNFNDLELAAIAIALDDEESEESSTTRKWSVHPLWRERQEKGEYVNLCKDLRSYEDKYWDYFKMTKESFDILHMKIKDDLTKGNTKFQIPISSKHRLALTLRFLTTGDSFKTISLNYRVGHSTVVQIIKETCRAIVNRLINEVMPQPNEETWKSIAHEFQRLWQFPNCIGALDGKHVTIEAPTNSGSVYFNYKKTYSIVLLALVDAHYNFIFIDVGSYGRNSDGGIFANSSLGQRLNNNSLNIPIGKHLPNTTITSPYVIVGDEAFPLKTYLMRPYPRDQAATNSANAYFNQRLTLARRLVEKAFGILTQKFRIYSRRIKSKPENVDYIILSTCVLHIFLRQRNDIGYLRQDSTATTDNSLRPLLAHVGRPSNNGFEVREIFKNYFVSERNNEIM